MNCPFYYMSVMGIINLVFLYNFSPLNYSHSQSKNVIAKNKMLLSVLCILEVFSTHSLCFLKPKLMLRLKYKKKKIQKINE